MLPVIPVVVAVASAAVLVKRKLARQANKQKFAELLAYVNSSNVPVDSDGHFDPNAKRADGLPLLFGLMSAPELLGALIDYGANPNICDANGTPAIIYAVRFYSSIDSIQIISTLLKHGADPNAMDCEGRTAIFYAKSKEVVSVLYKGGALLDIVDVSGKSPILYSFAFHTTEEFVRLGADVNAKDSDGRTPIFYATCYEELKLLREYGADFTVKDSFGKTPLFYAKSVEDLTLFSQFGIDLNAVDNDGRTALFYSFEHHTTEALVRMGADVNVRDREGNTVLFYISSPNDYNLVSLLLSRGANLETTNNKGEKFKYYDSYYQYFVEEFVVDNGSKFYNAVNHDNIIKVQILLKTGVDLDTRDQTIPYWNMIHLAVHRRNPRMIEVLAKGGVDINARLDGNICPLVKAVYSKDVECVKKLLECGADPSLARLAVSSSQTPEKIRQLFKDYDKNMQ